MAKVINITINDENENGQLYDYDEIEENLSKWKKEFTTKDIHDAFSNAIEGTPFEEDALMNLAMMIIEAKVINKLYPRDEYDKKFKKGEE